MGGPVGNMGNFCIMGYGFDSPRWLLEALPLLSFCQGGVSVLIWTKIVEWALNSNNNHNHLQSISWDDQWLLIFMSSLRPRF